MSLVAIEPANLCTVIVSPRQRAETTFHLLFEHLDKEPDYMLTEDVGEWNYGDGNGTCSYICLRQ